MVIQVCLLSVGLYASAPSWPVGGWLAGWLLHLWPPSLPPRLLLLLLLLPYDTCSSLPTDHDPPEMCLSLPCPSPSLPSYYYFATITPTSLAPRLAPSSSVPRSLSRTLSLVPSNTSTPSSSIT